MATQVKTIMENAKKQLQKAQEYQKRYFDAHHRQLEFEVGQKVLLSTKNPNSEATWNQEAASTLVWVIQGPLAC